MYSRHISKRDREERCHKKIFMTVLKENQLYNTHNMTALSLCQVKSILLATVTVHTHTFFCLSEARYSTLDWRSAKANQPNCVHASQRKSVGKCVCVCVHDWLWLAWPQSFNKRLKTPVDTILFLSMIRWSKEWVAWKKIII